MPKQIQSIDDLVPDSENANYGTESGRAMLERSFRELGAGRSVLADKNGKLIAGNKSTEIAAEIGLPVEVVRTRGDKLVVVVREDLDLDQDPAARRLAYADNRSSEVGLLWNVDQIAADLLNGVEMDGLFSDEYLTYLLGNAKDGADAPPTDQMYNPEEDSVDNLKHATVECPHCRETFTLTTKHIRTE